MTAFDGVLETWTGSDEDRVSIGAILQSFQGEDPMESLIPALHEIQHQYRYIPEEAVRIISSRWHIPTTDIYGVLTFYSDFKTEPQGVNTVWVCEGAACYFMGGPELGAAAQRELGVGYDETTEDGQWSLRRADFCFGACHLAPLVEINHEIVGRVSPAELAALLALPRPGGHQ